MAESIKSLDPDNLERTYKKIRKKNLKTLGGGYISTQIDFAKYVMKWLNNGKAPTDNKATITTAILVDVISAVERVTSKYTEECMMAWHNEVMKLEKDD